MKSMVELGKKEIREDFWFYNIKEKDLKNIEKEWEEFVEVRKVRNEDLIDKYDENLIDKYGIEVFDLFIEVYDYLL